MLSTVVDLTLNILGIDVDPVTFNAIGNWALVAVALATVIITAWQNRKSQKLALAQVGAAAKQVELTAQQTVLQHEQSSEFRKQQMRPRVQELIQTILSPSIQTLDRNAARAREMPLELREYLTLFLTDKFNPFAALVFRDFESQYKEFAAKMKRYDRDVCEPIRLTSSELYDILLTKVGQALPAIVAKFNASARFETLKIENVHSYVFVNTGILPVLQGEQEQIMIVPENQIWAEHRDDFLSITKDPEVVKRMNEVKVVTGKCAVASHALSNELSELRNKLGTEYDITRDKYFGAPTY